MLTMYIKDFPEFYEEFIKAPYKTELEVVSNDDEIIIGQGESDGIKYIPDNATVIDTKHCGGIIVGFPHSVTLFKFDNKENAPSWVDDLISFLRSKNLNARIVGNDILVGKYKVAGYMDRCISPEIQYFGIHISLNANVELIEKICNKKMLKIPKGLSEYGITRDEIIEALKIK